MKAHHFFVTTALLLGITATAHAASLRGGPLFATSNFENIYVCSIANHGSTTITFKEKLLRDKNGAQLVDTDTCGTTLDAGESCSIRASAPGSPGAGEEVHCTFGFTGRRKNVSGVLDVRESSSGNVLKVILLK